jgi:L-ascorbate metabolism protein UlaG (beta-lactamase superfamily)
MELKWLGHASWKLKTDGKVVYIDPYEGEYDEPADIILSTHHHDDHCKPDKVAMIKTDKTKIIAPRECGMKLEAEVHSLKPGESTRIGEIGVRAVEAYNFKRFRSPGQPFHPKGVGVGYLVFAEGKTIYHVGDSDFIDEMKDLTGIDIMLVPSGGTYTMDCPEAVEAAAAINPVRAIPMHVWDTDPNEFKSQLESVCSTKVDIMKPGETLSL